MKKQLLTGAFLLVALFSAKAQDACESAVELETGTTTIGEIDGEYYVGCWGTAATSPAAEWYYVVAPANGAFRINTNLEQNEGGDTRVSVYTGECGSDEFECWDGSDDVNPAQTGGNYLTDWQFPVLEGVTYYIAFDNRWSDAGFDVEVTFTGGDCPTSSLTEDWTDIASYYFCWSTQDLNEEEDNGAEWQLLASYNWDANEGNDNVVAIFSGSEFTDNVAANDDYLVSSAKNLIAGTEYTVSVVYNGIDVTVTDAEEVDHDVPANQSFEVLVGAEEDTYIIGEETGVVMDGATLLEAKTNATTGEYTFTPDADGEYVFAIHSNSDIDTGALAIFEINVDGTMGTKAVTADSFTVSPNPANSLVTIANADNMLINAVSVADINGRIVKTASFEGAAQAQVNVSDLANGVYMMTISSDKGSVTKKIVKN